MNWIPVAKKLPPLNKRVLVFGMIKKLNAVCPQVWEARRWSECSECAKFPSDHPLSQSLWLTPTDLEVTNVTHWAPTPRFE